MKKIFITLFLFLFLTGCTSQNDNLKFKEEYESLNNSLLEITIPNNNYIKYISKDKVLNIIDKGTGVIYVGNAKDNECREMINILINAADSTDLETINYYNDEDISFLSNYVTNVKVPIVLFVYEGQVKSYKQGISDEEELLDAYLDGIHEVLNDICDDECDD